MSRTQKTVVLGILLLAGATAPKLAGGRVALTARSAACVRGR
jgi:hypothetical protein